MFSVRAVYKTMSIKQECSKFATPPPGPVPVTQHQDDTSLNLVWLTGSWFSTRGGNPSRKMEAADLQPQMFHQHTQFQIVLMELAHSEKTVSDYTYFRYIGGFFNVQEPFHHVLTKPCSFVF